MAYLLRVYCSQVPVSENSKLMTFGSNHQYLECVKAAYEFASGELLSLIKEKVSINCYYLVTYKLLFQVFLFNLCLPLREFTVVLSYDASYILMVQYDLIGKLRSIKHYLLLDQVSLLNILWTWDENQSLFIYNMVLCGYLFQHAKCKHLVTVFSGVLLTSFYRKCNSLVSAKFLMALMQGLLLFIIPTKLHLVGCTWFVSMKDILHPILTFKD